MFNSIDFATFATLLVLLSIAGLFAGLLAGIFGIGGGNVLVPVLLEFLRLIGVDPAISTHMAIGTSLAIIVPTGIISYASHRKTGAPDQALLKEWQIWIPFGAICASLIVAQISANSLKVIFALLIGLVAIKMLFGKKDWKVANELPSYVWRSISGWLIGLFSTLMGVGGGVFNNTFMTSFGRPIHQAIATSSAVGVLIAVPAVIGYVWAGWGNPLLPSFALGYVHMLAAFLILPTSMLAAPFGARLAHKLPKRRLETAFGIFAAFVSVRIFYSMV